MKIIYHIQGVSWVFLLLAFMTPTTNASAFYSFENNLTKGKDALFQNDATLAKQYFAAAKKAGKGKQKKHARLLLRKMRYLDKYCGWIKKGNQQAESKSFRVAYEHYKNAQEALEESFRKYAAPDLDQALNLRIERLIQQSNRQRQTAFENAMDEGEKALFTDDPHSALTTFYYAKAQMYQNEISQFNINDRIEDAQRKADYQDYLAKGSDYLADGDLHNARNWFYKAKGKWETSEVEKNIEDVEVLLIEAYISEGESYFTIKAYKKALASFQKALKFRETDELSNWIDQTKDALYDQFLVQGDSLSNQHAYPKAIAAYEEAQSYWNTEEIKQRIHQAEEDHYNYLVEQGQSAFQEAAFEDALAHFESAATIKFTEEVKALISQTKERLYHLHYANAKSFLEKENFQEVLTQAKQAQSYKTTPEVQTLIKQAENGIAYKTHFKEGLTYLEENQPDKAHQMFVTAKSYWVTDEVNQQIQSLENLFETFDQYKKMGDQACQNGDLEIAVNQYQKARAVCNREGIDQKIKEVEEKLQKYNDHFSRGKSAYNQDNAEQALHHFTQAAQFNQTPEISNWIDRAKRMPCTITTQLHGNTDKFDKIRLEVVDYYTLDILYTADPTGTSYTFPKVAGGSDKKYYLRAYLIGDHQDKVALKEATCDCSKERKHEVGVAVE